MKTPRDRAMAFLAIFLMTITAAGLLYFLYYDRNMSALKNQQRTVETDIATREAALEEFEKSKPLLDQAKRLSLPESAKGGLRYQEEIEKMLAASRFPANKIASVKAKSGDSKAAVTASSKQKPPFTRVLIDIQVHGDLTMLTDFLDRFYRMPILHRIKSLQVARPTTRQPDQMPGELDIMLTAEALVLDGGEKRTTVLPENLKESEKPKRLARSDAAYEAIAGNNMFYGKFVPISEPPPDKGMDFNVLPEIVLDGIWTDNTGTYATLFDGANDYQYRIRKGLYGGYKVDKYFYLKDTRKPLEIGEELLAIKDAKGFEHRTFKIVRVDPSDVYLEDGGKIYQLHAGWRLNEVKALTSDEVKKRGLAKEEKKDDKGSAKPDDKKIGKDGTKPEAPKKDEGR